MRNKVIPCLMLAVVCSIGFAPACFAVEGIGGMYQASAEIVPLGEYPESALPPGEVYTNMHDRDDGEREASLDAVAYTGWVFLGWDLDENDYLKHEKPEETTGTDYKGSPTYGLRFLLHGNVTARAVYAYVGSGALYDELNKYDPAATAAEGETTYEVGVYERDTKGVDGDYGSLFCYPNVFQSQMDIPAGSAVLLAALPKDGNEFVRWDLYKENKPGIDHATSNIIVINIDAAFSIDVIFAPIQ